MINLSLLFVAYNPWLTSEGEIWGEHTPIYMAYTGKILVLEGPQAVRLCTNNHCQYVHVYDTYHNSNISCCGEGSVITNKVMTWETIMMLYTYWKDIINHVQWLDYTIIGNINYIKAYGKTNMSEYTVHYTVEFHHNIGILLTVNTQQPTACHSKIDIRCLFCSQIFVIMMMLWDGHTFHITGLCVWNPLVTKNDSNKT